MLIGKNNLFFLETIKTLVHEIKDANWMLVNSSVLLFYDINSEINDIDIFTDKKGAFNIGNCLKQYVVKQVEYSEKGIYRSYYGTFKIGKFKVEVMGDFEVFVNGKWKSGLYDLKNKIIFKHCGMDIPIASLSDLKGWYGNVLRNKDFSKLRLIKEKLDGDSFRLQ